MNKPLDLLVEYDPNGNAVPLVMRWQGQGIRFREMVWHRREWSNHVLHHFFGVKDEARLYTLDFNTESNDWTVAHIEHLSSVTT